MPIIATGGDSKTFAPAPAGVHQGVCVDVVDMGILKVEWKGQIKHQHKVRIVWQIDEAMEDNRRFIVQKRYTLSLHEKANLRKDLEAWRGKTFTAEELKGFDLEDKLIGVNCFLNVVHNNASNGNTYANIASIMPLKKGLPKMEAEKYVRVQDRTEAQANGNGHHEDIPDLTDDDIPF